MFLRLPIKPLPPFNLACPPVHAALSANIPRPGGGGRKGTHFSGRLSASHGPFILSVLACGKTSFTYFLLAAALLRCFGICARSVPDFAAGWVPMLTNAQSHESGTTNLSCADVGSVPEVEARPRKTLLPAHGVDLPRFPIATVLHRSATGRGLRGAPRHGAWRCLLLAGIERSACDA